VLRNQRLIEKEEPDMKSGESKTKYILKRDLVGVSSCYRDEILSTIFYDISVEQESLYAGTLYKKLYENFRCAHLFHDKCSYSHDNVVGCVTCVSSLSPTSYEMYSFEPECSWRDYEFE
jgi:hypothetical protein